MKQFLLDYFTFNKIERNGIFILCAIILFLLFFDRIIPFVIPQENINYSEFISEIDAFVQHKTIYRDSIENAKISRYSHFPVSKEQGIPIQFFKFDPNIATQEQWLKLGLSQKQSSTINNYLSKGGKFYKKEDLKKIYGISNSQYKMLEPYINIENHKQTNLDEKNTSNQLKLVDFEKKESPVLLININLADTSDLIQLKGIGSTFSLRIIKYRNNLGGFINKDQLLEVYGITKELIDSISPFISIDHNKIKKININTCLASDFKKHPYVNNWNITNSIINYRDQHGFYKSIEDIKKSDLVNDELYLKLAPYLTIE
ncbi:MAG: helix-hairpin-helix domain-containing protein [Bacteroidota bacterium]|nr:helix-hairpin-helix domain-containing protein [Bacteroidota bacterium]